MGRGLGQIPRKPQKSRRDLIAGILNERPPSPWEEQQVDANGRKVRSGRSETIFAANAKRVPDQVFENMKDMNPRERMKWLEVHDSILMRLRMFQPYLRGFDPPPNDASLETLRLLVAQIDRRLAINFGMEDSGDFIESMSKTIAGMEWTWKDAEQATDEEIEDFRQRAHRFRYGIERNIKMLVIKHSDRLAAITPEQRIMMQMATWVLKVMGPGIFGQVMKRAANDIRGYFGALGRIYTYATTSAPTKPTIEEVESDEEEESDEDEDLPEEKPQPVATPVPQTTIPSSVSFIRTP